MARKFVVSLDLLQNELLNARIQNLGTAPATPVEGQIYYNNTNGNKTLYFWNGTEWIPTSGSVEVITDTIGEYVKGGTGLTATFNDSTNETTLDLDNTAVTPGAYGSQTKIPTFTVDAQGRLTAAGEEEVATTLDITGDSGTTSINLLSEDLAVNGGEGIDVNVTENTITIVGEDASTTNKGIASFDSEDFNVTNGAVELEDTVIKSVTTDDGALTPSGHGISILGGEGIDVTHTGASITVKGEDATSTNKGIASFDETDFVVTSGDVAISEDRIEDIVDGLIVAGVGLDKVYNDNDGTLTLDIDSTVVTKDDQQTLTNKVLGTNIDLGADLDAGTYKIVNLGAPTEANDAATKAYVDAVAEGLHVHEAARVFVGTNIDLATALEAGNVVDGVTLVAGNRVLVNGQTNAAQNGIYVVTAAGPAQRAADFDTNLEIKSGDFIFVSLGSTYGNTGWVQTLSPAIIGTDAISFTQFSGAGTYTGGAGLTLDGTVFNVGQGTGIIVNANDVAIDTAVVARKYTSLIGNGTATSYTVNHNLNNQYATVQVYEGTNLVEADVALTSANSTTIGFSQAPAENQFRVVVTA